MIIWCNKDYLFITSNIEPQTGVLKPLPSDTKEERKAKLDKPFINKLDTHFTVDYLGSVYAIDIPRGYRWDGASIPRIFWRLIGSKDDNSFLNASLVHDMLCEYKNLVEYDRQLSSMIFREILISSGVSKAKAYTMYYAVDIFQKYFCDWGQK